MEIIKTFRHEYKYLIDYSEMLKLRSQFNSLLTPDRSSEGYIVRSLYFDSLEEQDYYDKLGGEYYRKKIRLRIYDPNSNQVKLEIKQKADYHQLKESLIITKNDALELINGNYQILLSYESEVAKKIYLIMQTGSYKPKVIIEYQRIAYITSTTTRITLDYNVKKSDNVSEFFNEKPNYLPVTTVPNGILEVKFDRFLEPYISNILNKYIAQNQSFSKYTTGRNI